MPSENRRAIIDAARQLFAQDGLPAVTIEAVAAALGITADEVAAEVVDAPHLRTTLAMEALAGPAALIDEAVAKTTHGEAALDGYLRTYVSYGLADPRRHVMPTFDLMFRRVVEKLTNDWGEDGLPQGIHPRRLVFISHLAALGLVAVTTNNIDIGGSIVHDQDDLLDEMSRALAAPTTMMRQLEALNDVATELAAIRDEKGRAHDLNNQVPATVRIQRELGDIPELICKPAMVNQMLFNLLLTAVQAIDAIGLVTVRTSASDGHVLVERELLPVERAHRLCTMPLKGSSRSTASWGSPAVGPVGDSVDKRGSRPLHGGGGCA